jgi:DNA-binding PadR family transcriptional regulator
MSSIEEQIPLTPAVFHILLALADGPTHGYAIMQEVETLTDGNLQMGPGTLYGSIKRMLKSGIIEEVAAPADDEDPRRRYYQLTAFGAEVAQAEAKRLSLLVNIARQRRLLGGA